MNDRTRTFEAMCQSILDGEHELAERLALDALEAGVPPLEAIDQGFVPGIREVGRLFGEGELFLPELVTSAQAMKAAMTVLQAELAEEAAGRWRGRLVIGTVPGDIHDIGKTLVGTLLSANGFEVIDLGVDVPIERFVDTARELDADFVGASALLTTTMTKQRDLVAAIGAAGLRARVLVGGAPVRRDWADQIGADGYAENALGAVELVRLLSGQEREQQ